MGAYRLEIGQSVRTKINTTTLPDAARNGSNGLPARSMAKPCEFVETTKAVHNNTIATTKRENNRRVGSLSPMGSQPGMEKCYCACEHLSIWLSCKAVGRGIGASNSTNEADRDSDSRLRRASMRTEKLAPRWRYASQSASYHIRGRRQR